MWRAAFFSDLVQLGEPGISPDTRRRQYLDELTATWGNSADFQKALATLTEHQLITPGFEPGVTGLLWTCRTKR